MRSSHNDDWIVRRINTSCIYVLLFGIFLNSVLVITDIFSSDLISQLTDATEIPTNVYRVLIISFFVVGFTWIVTEWYLGRWNRLKKRHNIAHNFLSLFITIFVIAIYTETQSTGVFLYMVLFTLVFLPAAVMFVLHWIYTRQINFGVEFKKYVRIPSPLGLFDTTSDSNSNSI